MKVEYFVYSLFFGVLMGGRFPFQALTVRGRAVSLLVAMLLRCLTLPAILSRSLRAFHANQLSFEY